ncbi:peptidase domain-containing ABC transporter [Methylobacterium sp. JK268]
MIGILAEIFSGGRQLPDLRQSEAAECGLACLAMVSAFHRRAVGLNTLRHQYPVSLKGMTLKTLIETAEKIGFASRPLRLDLDQLDELQTPAILHWDMAHFVVLKKVSRGTVTIHDPGAGPTRLTMAETSKHFTGVALELTPGLDSPPPPPVRTLTLATLFGPLSGLRQAALQILALSGILQLYVLASPFLMQIAVDDAIATNDRDLVLTLALGFALFLLVNTGAALLRVRIMAGVQSTLAFQMGAGLFRHLLRLPLGYFEKRHVGDLVSRFNATEPIRQLLAEGLITALIDGSMAVLTLVMILLYSPALSLVVLVALGLYVILRTVFYHRMRHVALELMVARAGEGTAFVETVRAIQSIKLFNRQAERGAVWMNRYAEMVRADTSIHALRKTFHALNGFIFGLETIAVVYLGAHAVLDERITVGMLFAFVAYKQQFVEKASALVENAIEFKMLDLYLDRLADIVVAEPERTAPRSLHIGREIVGEIEVRDVGFRYAQGEPFVFEGISFRIAAGEYVALTGPSGGGKTTLMKIMLGLLEPTEGEVLIDGIPLPQLGHEAYREAIGVVMQDDHLLSGTIADNICFFDERQNVEQMVRCATLAGIHEDIVAMPMGYNSLIGDMGSSLSGGQRQRVLLARALYRNPRILFMDEGTSNLDPAMEARVSTAVQELGLTRVIIAHRPETIASASRRLVMDAAGLREEGAVRHPPVLVSSASRDHGGGGAPDSFAR